MDDLGTQAQAYADRLIANGHVPQSIRDELARRLYLAARAFHAGQVVSQGEANAAELFKPSKPPHGWKPGMPGHVSARELRSLKSMNLVQSRGRGRHPRNWAAEKFIEHMIPIAAMLGIEAKPSYYNTPRPSRFSELCDDWLARFAPDAEIPIQAYQDVLNRQN